MVWAFHVRHMAVSNEGTAHHVGYVRSPQFAGLPPARYFEATKIEDGEYTYLPTTVKGFFTRTKNP